MDSRFQSGHRPGAITRLLGHLTGCIWLSLAGWVVVFAAGLAGVGIATDQTPLGMWLVTSAGFGLLLLLGGGWWPALLASAFAGVALALAAQAGYPGSTHDVRAGLDVMVGLSLFISAWSLVLTGALLRMGHAHSEQDKAA